MPVRWYYESQVGTVGPVSMAELRFLINVGTIGVSTLVRPGEEGPWLVAEKVASLLGATGEVENAGGCAIETPEWHFSLKGHNKQGPVPWRALKAMILEGTLQPDELVWKPGMALWVPASQVQGLIADVVDTAAQDRRTRSMACLRSPVLLAAIGAMVLLGLITGAVGWKWAQTGLRDQRDTGAATARAVTEKGRRPKAGVGAVEQLLDDARTAVRVEQLGTATRHLDQYLTSAGAEQVDAAKLLRREIEQATSVAEAARIARNLDDEPLKAYLQDGVQSLVAAIGTSELQPIYERTLLRAFRQENNRRQVVPRGAIAQNPRPVEADPIAQNQDAAPERAAAAEAPAPPEQPRLSIFGPAGPAARGPVGKPVAKNDDARLPRRPGPIPADLDYLLAKPGEFAESTLVLNGLFKIGTKFTEVRGPDGQVLGRSLPVARNDDSMVCTVDGKVGRQNAFLLLDDRLATLLERVFDKLHLKTTIKPLYKCILTVTTRRLLVNGSPTPVIVISSMEVLGGCNYLSVARHQYSQAFRTLSVTPQEADVDFGDGDLWVERLGGEEDFVKPIRRKFREMQRRAITNRDSAVIDNILRRELANVVSTASAINHIVAMEGLRRMRISP
jgi:GYF domain 2